MEEINPVQFAKKQEAFLHECFSGQLSLARNTELQESFLCHTKRGNQCRGESKVPRSPFKKRGTDVLKGKMKEKRKHYISPAKNTFVKKDTLF